MGTGNTIGPYVVMTGPITMGDDNWFGAGVVLGAPPEVRTFRHPRSSADGAGNGIVIGSRNVFREYSQVHHGSKGTTVVGDDAFIMNQCYIAHDCSIGNAATLASSVLLAGHVVIGEGANLGLGTSVHQFRRIGAWAMVGMASVVTRDIPVFAKAFGNPAAVRGANSVGMQRRGIDEATIREVTTLYETSASTDRSSAEGLPGLARYFDDRRD